MEFLGYMRPDGSAGIRNHLCVVPVGSFAGYVCRQLLGMVQGITLVSGLPGQFIPQGAQSYLRTTLIGAVTNPNIGGVIVLAGNLSDNSVVDSLAHSVSLTGRPVRVIRLPDYGGIGQASAAALQAVVEMKRDMSTARRELVPVNKLCVAFDFSGSMAVEEGKLLPVFDRCSDRFVEEGSRTLYFGEMEESLLKLLARRATGSGVTDILMASRGRDNVFARDELNNEDQWGSAPIEGTVVFPQALPEKPGVYVAVSDGFAPEKVVSAGIHLIVSTPGGQPLVDSFVPVLRVATDTWNLRDIIDLDLSGFLRGKLSSEDAAILLVSEILATCSGKLTAGEVFLQAMGAG
ncbi:D-galactarate dehydratase/Altronate hydrolase domain protein [Desulfofundulus kuznetsovii DSM 6115]|uniref:D-galactarate dehydratase/Altronate hydrolase domain protein n=1 Tax=Desulfofundulus kuznetsovii (strain DSM 6115 / VKM B-1805 / 17) TaxID=760568 RepID=A0AAU8PKK9_DESK7|nr:D-galactarate dehydratase/Altronate hydrolase domain protein [Desulfofundulus kuznetsovii DSM 6115]